MKIKGDENPPVLFELRPDRTLLDPNFQGYKLSLDSLPIYTLPLNSGVDHAVPTEEQYSLLQVKLSGLSNHAWIDPWNSGTVYVLDKNWNLLKAWVNPETMTFKNIAPVWKVPETPAKKPGRLNVTLIFFDETHAVLADGCGRIYLIETGPRAVVGDSLNEWKVSLTEEPFADKNNPEFVLLDGRGYNAVENPETGYLDVICLRINERKEWQEFLDNHQNKYLSSVKHPFVSLLDWITFSRDKDNAWELKSSKILVGGSGVEYATIEQGGSALYLSSDEPFYFYYDSENPIAKLEVGESSLSNEEIGDGDKEKDGKSDYVWSQTNENITLWFRLPEPSVKSDLIVDISVNDIHIEYKRQGMLDGKLFAGIKSSEVIWTLESGKLEIVLPKIDQELMWTELIPGNTSGEQITDPELIEQIHSQLLHMCSDKWGEDPHNTQVYDPNQLEECDAFPADTALLMRIDRKLQRITNQTSLGSHQWLFNVITHPATVPSLCIRHDVDGIVWEPEVAIENSPGIFEWSCKHIGTFQAFGYVQASKENRKFTVASPNLSYVAICTAVKHIHIYRQPSQIENELRNRKTGEQVSHVAKQQVIALDPPVEIMGTCADNQFLFVVSPENIHAIRMT